MYLYYASINRSLILGTTDCTKRRSAAIRDLGRNTGGAGGLPSACDSPVMIFLLIAIIASSNLRDSSFHPRSLVQTAPTAPPECPTDRVEACRHPHPKNF